MSTAKGTVNSSPMTPIGQAGLCGAHTTPGPVPMGISDLLSTALRQRKGTLSDLRSVVIREKKLFHCFLDAWEGRFYVRYKDEGKAERCQLRYRFILECHLGRKLQRAEVVHHINHIKTDDRLENLELTTFSDHTKKHAKEAQEHGYVWGRNALPKNERPDDKRRCAKCEEIKPTDQFPKRTQKRHEGTYSSYCKACHSKLSVSYRKPGYWKDYRRKKKLLSAGISSTPSRVR